MNFFQKVRGPPGSKPLRRALNDCVDEQFVEFVARCVEWDPEKRWTPRDAMKDVWLRKKHTEVCLKFLSNIVNNIYCK